MYSVDNQDRVLELKDVPQSDVGAPAPLVLSAERVTLLAYLVQDKEREFDGRVLTDSDVARLVESWALIEFPGCVSYMFGLPNDEAFEGHPLANHGLHPYAAFQIENSSWIRELERRNSIHPSHRPQQFQRLKHFVFAFHDSTFECVADGFTVAVHEGSMETLLPELYRRLQ